MMTDLITQFPLQLSEALDIASGSQLSPPMKPINKIVICGLGGSGIGGTIAREILFEDAKVPILTSNSYTLPSCADEETLVICSSYSGNTEETLECFHSAISKNCKTVCVTSGGKLAQLAREHKADLISLPGGMPPRACLGYSLTQLLHIIAHYKLSGNHSHQIKSAATIIFEKQEKLKKEAESIASVLQDKTPVIYATSNHEGIAIRFRQQLNENAKILCWHHVFPEMNHNELVGWSHAYPEVAVVVVKDSDENPRNKLRMNFCMEIFRNLAGKVIEIPSEGNTALEKKLCWIHLVDWVSVYLAELRKVDAMDIKVIDKLKGELASR